jgi:hypothetical protein
VLLLATAAGCTARRPPTIAARVEPSVGLYRGLIEPAGGEPRRFRVLLYAALPDRIHGEIVSPVGTTEMIIDGGAGRLAVTINDEGVSYVGDAEPSALERILGVRLTLRELVSGLLTGQLDDDAWRVDRSSSADGELPASIEFRSSNAKLTLVLKRLRPLGTDPRDLGRGAPPEGTERRPLDALGQDERTGEPRLEAG